MTPVWIDALLDSPQYEKFKRDYEVFNTTWQTWLAYQRALSSIPNASFGLPYRTEGGLTHEPNSRLTRGTCRTCA